MKRLYAYSDPDCRGARSRQVLALVVVVLVVALLVPACRFTGADTDGSAFLHGADEPGLLNTREQLDFMRERVAAGDEPWTGGYAAIPSYLNHQPEPVEHYFDPAGHQGAPDDLMQPALRLDGEAAYGSALHWVVSRDSAHAEKAVEILNAWGGTLKSIETRLDGPLSTSYNWPRLIYAADIMRTSYNGWSAEDQARFETLLTDVIWDATRRAIDKDNKNNWRSVGINCRMAIAVYTRDEQKFQETLEVLRDQIGSYCYPSGQSVETARDMLHVQMGLGGMIAAAEIAWNQGVDVYSHLDNRLLTCTEWHIPHIMGLADAEWPDSFDSPFYAPEEMLVGGPQVEMWGRQVDVRKGGFAAPRAVGRVWHFYEMVYNHYHHRMGLPAPNTWRILTERSPALDYNEPRDGVRGIPVRPEVASQPGGWGTLTHMRHDLVEQ